MKIFELCWVGLLFTFQTAAWATPSLSAKRISNIEIRVRLKHELQAVEVSGLGLQISPPTGFVDAAAPVGPERVRITHDSHGVWHIRSMTSHKSLRLRTDRLAVRGQMLRVGVLPTPFDFEVIPNPGSGMDVVARLDLDKYLRGVLPAEMPASWPLEALKAQAVAARSFVLRQAFDRHDRYFDVDSTVMDQVYKFLNEVGDHPDWINRVARAVDETRGEILFDAKRKVLKAFYSADCGCQSEDPKFVWGKIEAFESVKDPTCSLRKPTEWSLNVERSEVRRKLIAALALPTDAGMRAVQVAGRTPSGRVSQVVATMDVDGRSHKILMSSQEFRHIFGFQKVQSSDFSLHWLGDALKITGQGSGHGVGLCQRGARAMAEQGMGYREILKTYYPLAILRSPKRT